MFRDQDILSLKKHGPDDQINTQGSLLRTKLVVPATRRDTGNCLVPSLGNPRRGWCAVAGEGHWEHLANVETGGENTGCGMNQPNNF